MQIDYRVADLNGRSRLEYKAELDTSPIRGPLKLAIPIARVFTFFQLRYFMRNLRRLAESSARSDASRSASTAAR